MTRRQRQRPRGTIRTQCARRSLRFRWNRAFSVPVPPNVDTSADSRTAHILHPSRITATSPPSHHTSSSPRSPFIYKCNRNRNRSPARAPPSLSLQASWHTPHPQYLL
ncbi:hypothetical protein K439DRAFT_1632064 [Ramaria rubella]|nr:hypothetical protein K439DRAFT_1632064 [Ramaria rubella]